MYVHKRCKPSDAEIDMERTVHGYCGICNNQGTIYLVVGTEDSYRHKRQGVTYTVTAVGALTAEEVAIAKAKTNTTDIPIETPLEPELTEEIEAVEEAVETAVEAEIEAAVPEKRQPEKTPVEAEPAILEIKEPDGTTTLLEAESKPSAELTQEDYEEFVDEIHEEAIAEADEPTEQPLEAESEDITVETVTADEATEFAKKAEQAEEARKAKIAALEAQLAELKK